jgi:hypothetical protein
MALRQERTDYHLRTCVHTIHSCMHTHLQTHEPTDNHKHNHNTPMPLDKLIIILAYGFLQTQTLLFLSLDILFFVYFIENQKVLPTSTEQ